MKKNVFLAPFYKFCTIKNFGQGFFNKRENSIMSIKHLRYSKIVFNLFIQSNFNIERQMKETFKKIIYGEFVGHISKWF